MRGICDGCGNTRTITLRINPKGSIFKFIDGKRIQPKEERFCEDCAEIKMRRMLEWGLNG
jgi:hypothetical protein